MAIGDARLAAGQLARTQAESWDACVAMLLGPRMPGEPQDIKRGQAIELAKAALRAAGEPVLAASLKA